MAIDQSVTTKAGHLRSLLLDKTGRFNQCPLMNVARPLQPVTRPVLAWLTVALFGFLAPALSMVLLVDAAVPSRLAAIGGPILAVGMMGTGMIGAAVAGRLWIGVLLSVLAGAGLLLLAFGLGAPMSPHPLSLVLAVVIASLSFAARGALFARSGAGKGWWIAVFVVAGEAAILVTASIEPGMWPGWLLVLLPAQWANMAIQSALVGTGALSASAAMVALGGTAAATLLVVRMWPRRWTYVVMFTTWLALSALVWHWHGPFA